MAAYPYDFSRYLSNPSPFGSIPDRPSGLSFEPISTPDMGFSRRQNPLEEGLRNWRDSYHTFDDWLKAFTLPYRYEAQFPTRANSVGPAPADYGNPNFFTLKANF